MRANHGFPRVGRCGIVDGLAVRGPDGSVADMDVPACLRQRERGRYVCRVLSDLDWMVVFFFLTPRVLSFDKHVGS